MNSCMMRYVGQAVAGLVVLVSIVFGASTASAIVYRPATSGLPGVVVTPGFSMSFYVPERVGTQPNTDYPTNPNNIAQVERYLEKPVIIGKDVRHVGKGNSNKRNNPAGRIFVIDVKNWGILTFFYPTVINNFTVSLPSYVGRMTNIQWEVFDLVQLPNPPVPGVPVPPAIYLMGTALGGMAALRRKKKALEKSGGSA
jgi:hypothetical protein